MKAKEAREMSISYFSKTRKDIALMMTILAEKENAQ